MRSRPADVDLRRRPLQTLVDSIQVLAMKFAVKRIIRSVTGVPREPLKLRPAILFAVNTTEVAYYFLREQTASLQRHGFDVHVIAWPGPWISAHELAHEFQAPVHKIRITRTVSFCTDLLSLIQIVHLLYRLSPVCMYATTPKAGLLAMVAGWIMRTPRRLYLIRGFPYVNYPLPARKAMALLDRIACRAAHRVLAVSRSSERYAVSRRICPHGKIAVIAHGSSHGIDGAHFSPEKFSRKARADIRKKLCIAPNAFVYGFVGRMVKDKGIDDLVAAFGMVTRECPDSALLLVGPFSTPRGGISRQTRTVIGRDVCIHATGPVKDPVELYAIMNILVHPSLREGFPNVILEAVAMEIPVITTQAMGCLDISEDLNITSTVAPGDKEALAAVMIAMRKDSKDSSSKLAKRRHLALRLYDNNRLAERYSKEIAGPMHALYDQSASKS